MAETPYPLVWDFYRKVDGAKSLGGVIHYFNEQSQSLYLKDGLATKTCLIEKGNWRSATNSEEIKITNDAWQTLRFDHVSNSCLYGAATDGSKLTFIRYTYGLDLSGITNSWNFSSQIDNAISQFNATVQNINPSIFGSESSLLQPGGYVTMFVRMGDSEAYPMSIMWLDETNYDDRSDTISISGRNTVGFYLKDQTFDGMIKDGVFTSEVTEVIFKVVATKDKKDDERSFKDIIEYILKEYAGLTKFVVQENENGKTNEFKFNPSEPLLNGIQKILDFYIESEKDADGKTTTVEHTWEIVEGGDGTIYVGRDDWIKDYVPKGHYVFDEGRDVFTRKTLKSSDAAYTRLRVTGKGSGGSDLKAVIVPINVYKYWSLGKHKTKHISAPDGKTQEELKTWAEAQATRYQYSGITEDLTGPFRPQLLVGDIATINHGNSKNGSILGIITEVRQTFSMQSGFRTEFSVDSGGYATGVDDTVSPVYSRAAQVDGYNRKQRLVDVVRKATNK